MPKIDPKEYLTKRGVQPPEPEYEPQPAINDEEYAAKIQYLMQLQAAVEQQQAELEAYAANLQAQMQPDQVSMVKPEPETVLTGFTKPSPVDGFTTYDNEGLSYAKSLFRDDTIESIMDFLGRMKVTLTVSLKFAEIYLISASQDSVLTWRNSWHLQRAADKFRLKMLEFRLSLTGADSDCLLFPDFDLITEVMADRLETRYGRSYEGFERKSGITNYTYSHNFEGQVNPDITSRSEKSGLAKLGKFNIFQR